MEIQWLDKRKIQRDALLSKKWSKQHFRQYLQREKYLWPLSKEWKWFLWAVFSAVFFLPVYLTVYKLSKVILSTAERTVLKSWRQFLSGQDNLLTAFVYLLRWLDRIIARLFGCIQVVKHPEKNPLCLPRT